MSLLTPAPTKCSEEDACVAIGGFACEHRLVMAVQTDLRTLLAKASPLRSGDQLAGVAARTQEERVRAQMELADTALTRFLDEPVVPYEQTLK